MTLVTGDRLALADDGQVTVQYNASRRNISFTTYKQSGDVYAIPSDVQQLVLTGQADPSLFDLTRLLAYGAKTQSTATDVIVQYAPGAGTSLRSALAGPNGGGAKITHRLSSVNALAVRAPHATTSTFWNSVTTTSGHTAKLRPTVHKVWLDELLKPTDQQSTPQVGAPTAWAAGFDGTGAKVGIVDTGIDATHPDLVGKVAAAQDFTSDGNTNDDVGHGTHVASIIAGTGAASGGAQKGVAPGATLVSAKACTAAGCEQSAIIDAMQWASAQPGVKVVNMSLGGAPSGGSDPLDQAVDNLTASSGVLFVVAAGNSGPGYGTVGSPGEADAALTVGAVDKSDAIASFSSRGPRIVDSALKPDITAPGVAITGACSSTGTFCSPGQTYVQLSGTSMATPHVAGGAAVLAEAHPTWSPAQLKAALMGSANPNSSLDTFTQGAGRLDVGRGYAQPVLADPPSVSLGLQNGPRSGYPTLTRTVTYSNTTASPVTLSLNYAVDDPTGAPAPSGMFSLSASSVTVPANGQATVTLTANLSVNGPNGRYTGFITATSGTLRVETPIGDDQELTYAVTADVTGRAGGAPSSFAVYFATTVGNTIFVYGTGGGGGQTSATLSLPPGTYMVYSNVYDVDTQGNQSLSLLSYPQLTVNAAQNLTVDARTASAVSASVPDSAATLLRTEVGAQFTPNGALGPSVSTNIPAGTSVYTGQLGPANSFVFGFLSKVVSTLYDPGPGGGVTDSPHLYQVANFINQQMPTGLAQNETAATLATVNAVFGAQQAGDSGYAVGIAQPNQQPNFTSSFTVAVPLTLPAQQVQSFNTDNGVRWFSTFQEQDPNGNDVNDLTSSLTAYTGGSTTAHVWNKPVFGPAFTTTVGPLNWVIRTGDLICPDVPLTGDSSGDAGHPGLTTSTSGSLTLKLNGAVVGSQSYPNNFNYCYPVPATWSNGYELDASVQRASGVQLSTNISAVWTFSSASVDPNSTLPLQIWAASFAPSLNSANTAPAGVSFQIPVTALPQPGSAAAGLQALTVDYSTDDGTTWQPAAVSTVNAQTGSYTATVMHPNITGFVSLRAHITDFAGNTATETITRAYQIAPGA
ncbi:S8 family serine peptidase [Actinocrinis puniceicyclus]|uniref:S8 family serine peptidase n=1 Tax=Actinocrinis puniceicyclus TaxID=977794 RepID=A0A8J8BC87_9ACTN|nr:S8 family serine peptidase [Actinocrinis puniceicyclus]MBS2964867.1 S8 family serine peptidase [Actinocrinis puniceicyclus]